MLGSAIVGRGVGLVDAQWWWMGGVVLGTGGVADAPGPRKPFIVNLSPSGRLRLKVHRRARSRALRLRAGGSLGNGRTATERFRGACEDGEK